MIRRQPTRLLLHREEMATGTVATTPGWEGRTGAEGGRYGWCYAGVPGVVAFVSNARSQKKHVACHVRVGVIYVPRMG